MNRIRYTVAEVRKNAFFQLPKFLFEEEFKSLSNDARVLYALLRDRHDLSIKNNWINYSNEVYFIYSRENMGEMLNLSKPTVIKAMNDLKKHNLVQEERLGQGKTNRIFLMLVENPAFTMQTECSEVNNLNVQKSKSFTSERKKSLPQEVKNLYPNDTELNEHEIIDTESSQSQSQSQTKKADMTPTHDNDFQKIENILKDNIDYSYITRQDDREFVDSLLSIMLDVITTASPNTVKIGKETKSRETVKSVFLKLNNEHITLVIDQFKAQRHKITHKTAYLRTSLYNSFLEIEPHYTNAVRADGMV